MPHAYDNAVFVPKPPNSVLRFLLVTSFDKSIRDIQVHGVHIQGKSDHLHNVLELFLSSLFSTLVVVVLGS